MAKIFNIFRKKDLWYDILCCCKKKPGNNRASIEARYSKYLKDLRTFNKDRDIISFISKVNSMEARFDIIEDQVEKMNLSSKKVKLNRTLRS